MLSAVPSTPPPSTSGTEERAVCRETFREALEQERWTELGLTSGSHPPPGPGATCFWAEVHAVCVGQHLRGQVVTGLFAMHRQGCFLLASCVTKTSELRAIVYIHH